MNLGWQEMLKTKIWQQGSLTLTTINKEVWSRVTNPQPTRLMHQKLEEKRAKDIFYRCDRKYSKVHKCTNKKLFYIDCEEEEENE